MLIVARLIAAGLGLFMLYFVLGGLLAYPIFYWPDLIMGLVLTASAILPARLATIMLPIAGAYALGVYAVAAANQVHLGSSISPLLVASIVGAGALTIMASATLAVRLGQRG